MASANVLLFRDEENVLSEHDSKQAFKAPFPPGKNIARGLRDSAQKTSVSSNLGSKSNGQPKSSQPPSKSDRRSQKLKEIDDLLRKFPEEFNEVPMVGKEPDFVAECGNFLLSVNQAAFELKTISKCVFKPPSSRKLGDISNRPKAEVMVAIPDVFVDDFF